MSLGEMKGSAFASKYTVNKDVSTKYTAAVAKVKAAPAGTTISSAGKVTAIPATPSLVGEIIQKGPIVGLFDLTKDVFYGSAEDNLKTVISTVPIDVLTTTTQMGVTEETKQNLSDYVMTNPVIKDIIKKEYTDKPNLLTGPGGPLEPYVPKVDLPELKLPDVGGFLDTAKWAVIGVAALIGVYLVAKAFGGKK